MDSTKRILCCVVSIAVLTVIVPVTALRAYEQNNDFIPDAFPKKIDEHTFSIPVDPDELIVACPHAAESLIDELQALFEEKCGKKIPFRNAENIRGNDLRSHHLIIIGNISNNRLALDLYKRRFAFSDAYFPGAGGVIIHPAESIWNPEKNIIVIGVSRDEDIASGFKKFVSMLEKNTAAIGIMHHLTTDLKFPKPPASVQSTFDHVRNNLRTTMAPYWNIGNWGLLYFLSGDTQWAEHFRDGFYLCYERAEKTGQWIPESWTNVYFNLWKMVMTWELLDDDPFFTPEDRKIINEVIWGYTRFIRWLPNLDEQFAPPGEARQNHTTFLGLSLYFSYRYLTENYGITGLDSMEEKFRRAFDDGQAHSFRANDDAGSYLYLSPLHHLTYTMAENDDSFCESGRLRTLIDLVTVTMDNRRDPVSFGDVGGYNHRTKGSARGRELKFFGMGAWYYGEGQYQWLYNWGAKDRVISLDTMNDEDAGKEENPIKMHFGSDRVFTVEDMYSGVYAVDIEEEPPSRYLGVFPVTLDESSLRWSAMRSTDNGQIPSVTGRYFDKISYRRSFDPQDEYLLLDGLSTLSHGHHDGNTISRLTWKDHVWLFDLDYIKLTPKYHNGVMVTRNGVQEPPPPLTVLNDAADFERIGFTRTTSENYNGADWERTIVWRKGKYFLFLDRINALREGAFKLEARWRTRGEVDLSENHLTVRQGDKRFNIISADESQRSLVDEPDGSRSRWNYPYGDGSITVCRARKNMTMAPGDDWIFANLMYVEDDPASLPVKLYKVGDGLYAVDDEESRDLIGLNPDVLADEGVFTDCSLFFKDSRHIWLIGATYLRFRNAYIEAPENVNFEINFRNRTGKLVVPKESTGKFRLRNLELKRSDISGTGKKESVEIGSGTYTFNFDFSFKGDFWKNRVPLLPLRSAARKMSPGLRHDRPENFGVELIRAHKANDAITASCPDGAAVLTADVRGQVTRYEGNSRTEVFRIASERPVRCIHAADINGDGLSEIIAGDDKANLYCYDSSGNQLWKHTLTKFYGSDANAVDITAGDIDHSGTLTVLVANAGWKVYAINPDGSIRWESFVFYHPLTKVRILDNGRNNVYIAAGTEYHTPLNVISPEDGKVMWHVWEEMGSEFISTTDYCGIHLTDMVFVDTDGDNSREIVFGTKYNSMYALEPEDGVTIWTANVGGEVTVMKTMTCLRDNTELILVGTDSGNLFIYDRTGKRLNSIDFGNGITDVEVLNRPEKGRTDIAVSTDDGRLIICDDRLLIRASHYLEGSTIKDIVLQGFSEGDFTFHVVTGAGVEFMKYHPYYLKKSRHY